MVTNVENIKKRATYEYEKSLIKLKIIRDNFPPSINTKLLAREMIEKHEYFKDYKLKGLMVIISVVIRDPDIGYEKTSNGNRPVYLKKSLMMV